MNGGLEQLFIDLEEALEDDNFHSEASIIELVHEKLSEGKKLILSKNEDGTTYNIAEEVETKPEEIVLPKGFETETLIKVDYHVFDKFVKDKLGIEYEFLLAVEADNDTDYRYDLTNDLVEWDFGEIENQVKAELVDIYPQDVLYYLIKKGHLPEAIYLIQVSW